jgi:arginyl-tRNA synthetase
MIRDILKNEIQKATEKLFAKKVDFMISPADIHGDYATNVAMVLGGDPRENAEKIREKLLQSKKINKFFSKIEIAGPGFLNFWLSEDGLKEGVKFALKKKFNFGDNKKVQVDFISANPTGELHIGHGRSAFFGDSLSNILKLAGYKVEREYYINDAISSAQIKELGKTALGKGTGYLTDYLKLKIKNLKLKIKNEGEAGYLLAAEIQKDNQRFIEKDLGIKFDNWFSEEKELHRKKMVEKILELLKKKGLVYEKEGALWLKISQYGDDEDRVIMRSDGTPTYFLTDIAYHVNKFERGFKTVIDIWGADHQGHEKRMYAAKKALGWKGDLKILITQLVTLKERGEKKKFSKRKGSVVLLKDLLKEVGLDAMRWFFLEKALSTHMEFDMQLAKERSKKNPVYYVQYSHARACSILRKAGLLAKNLDFSSPAFIFKYTNDPTANPKEEKSNFSPMKEKSNFLQRNLILKLIQFPEIIEDISKDYQVHRLTTYVYELAKVFTDFYENVPVLKAETEELKKSRLALVFVSRNILEKSLSLMGISAPLKM